MNIYIIIENANRELFHKAILASFLAFEGHKVIIGEKNEFRKKIDALPPGLIIEKGVMKGSIYRFKKWKTKGHVIFCFDEESLTYPNDKQYFGLKCDKGIENYIDYFFVSGTRHYKTLIKRFKKHQLILTGVPRFELLKNPYKNIFAKKAANLKKKYGEYILICSRFGNVNFYEGKKKKHPKNIYGNYISTSKKIFKNFIKIPEKISKIYPNNNIIIRPHPSEDPEIWKETLFVNKNFKVIYDDELYPWLLGSKFVIQNRCSTGIEAYFLKKKVISFEPYPMKDEINVLFSNLGKSFKTIDQFNKKNLKYDKNYWTKSHTKKIKHYIENISGVNSFNIIMKTVKKIDEEILLENKVSNINFSLRDRMVVLKDKLFKPKSNFKKYSLHKIGKFDLSKVEEIIRLSNLYYKSVKKMFIKQIGKKIFLIETT